MAYDPNTPQDANEPPDVSQPKITQNFQKLKTFLEFNHTDITQNDEGKHNFVTLPKQDSSPTTGADEMALFVKEEASKLNLILREKSNGEERKLNPQETAADNGKLVMPGGLILLWGSKEGEFRDEGGKLLFQVDFHTRFPNAFFNVQFVPFGYEPKRGRQDGDRGAFLLNVGSQTGFKVDRLSMDKKASFSYFAVGM